MSADNEIIKATDNEIIKALEDWMKNFEGKAVDYMKISFALDLINHQKAEYKDLLEQFRILDCECERLEEANEKQKAEIERLCVELDLAKAFYKEKEAEFSLLNYRHNKTLNQLNDYQSITRAEAVKEFVKKAKEKSYPFPCAIGVEYAVTIRSLDETKKEMVGEL